MAVIRIVERYAIKRIILAMSVMTGIVIAVIWVTQALRRLDLVTAKGQTLAQYLLITLYSLPLQIQTALPFALIAAMLSVFVSLARDHELEALHAIGSRHPPALRIAILSGVITACLTALLTLYATPRFLGQMRVEISKVHVDLITNLIQPGAFLDIEPGITFHIAGRNANGHLEGLLLADEREDVASVVYQAARGQIIEVEGDARLIMREGTIQRRANADGALSIASFDSYAFDISVFKKASSDPVYKIYERPTRTLLAGYRHGHDSGRIRAELHDRITQPLYPPCYALLVLAIAGRPRPNRGSQAAGVMLAIFACALIRIAEFGLVLALARRSELVFALYLFPLAIFVGIIWVLCAQRAPWWIAVPGGVLERWLEILFLAFRGGARAPHVTGAKS